MVNNRLFIHTFMLLVLIGVADFICNVFYFYWTVWWADIPMHFLAGGCVSMAFIWIYSNFFSLERLSNTQIVRVGVISAVLIGIVWEIFELHYGVTSLADGRVYYIDTIKDLCMDTSGGILGGLYAVYLLPKKVTQTIYNG